MKIIDGKGMILGRLASVVAKDLLKGEEVRIFNCEEVIISGSKKVVKPKFEELRRKGSKGSLKGPKIPRVGYRIVKRAIRGMLPNYRVGRGRLAYKRLLCYNGIPKEFENKKTEKLDLIKNIKHVKVKILEK